MLLRQTLALVGGGSAALAPSGARLLRTGRRGAQRLVRAPRPSSSDDAPPKQPRPPKEPLVALPPLTRVRDLAKALQQPLERVLPLVASRARRKLHMNTTDGARFEFANVRQVAVPFALAQRVAAHFGRRAALAVVEPDFTPLPPPRALAPNSALVRAPVVAVMGHVDHGKTTLLDSLRGANIAAREAHGITQKIHACDAQLSAQLRATFLDTPGHFHFFRMRSSAARLADLVVLVVAADEGCLLQTEEAIGAIEDARLPVIACINKVDVATREQVEHVKRELREYVALQSCPIIEISAKEQLNLDGLRAAIAELVEAPAAMSERVVDVADGTPAEGVVLESVAARGRGTVLRVLLRNGVLHRQDHFVAGMIHGAVRSLRNTDGEEVTRALPGTVVDVIYANKSKNVDAPNEDGFFVLPEARARQVIEQRQMALDYEENMIPDENAKRASSANDNSSINARIEEEEDEEEDDLDDLNEDDLVETKSVIVKADTAGSLTSIQDTVDQMVGISTARIGIGNITTKDIDVAINGKCPIFGFNIKMHPKEKRLAASRGVRVILHTTIHGLIEDIEAFEKAK